MEQVSLMADAYISLAATAAPVDEDGHHLSTMTFPSHLRRATRALNKARQTPPVPPFCRRITHSLFFSLVQPSMLHCLLHATLLLQCGLLASFDTEVF